MIKKTKVFIKLLPAAIFLVATILAFIPLNSAVALDGSEFKAGRIIDDYIFTNKYSMSVPQIQAFLDSKIPVCDTDGSEPYAGTTRAAYAAVSLSGNTTPFICLNQYYENPDATYAVAHTYVDTSGQTVNNVYNYHQNNYYQITGFSTVYNNNDPAQGISVVRPIYQNMNGVVPAGAKSAAQLIWDVAQMYTINPQALIVLLQKEQGIVTDDWAWAVQYEKATGYMCPDTAPCNATKAGFYNQIENAAWQFRADIDNIASLDDWGYYGLGWNNIRYSPNAACGTKAVYIENAATAALYKYTPYTPNDAALANLYGTGDACSAYGNRNFWRYFNDWFGTTIEGTYPSPLYLDTTSRKIYIIWQGYKYYVPSFDYLIAWRLHNRPVTEMDESFFEQFSNGDNLSNIAKASDDPNSPLYLLDDGKRYSIPYDACRYGLEGSSKPTTWGLDCFNTSTSKSYPKSLINAYTVNDIELPIMIAFHDSVWKLEEGKKRRIIDSFVIDVLGGWSKVRWMKDLNASQPEGKLLMRNGYTVKFTDSDLIYRYDNNALHRVTSINLFLAWGLEKQPVHTIPIAYNADDSLPVAEDASYTAYDSATDSYYLIDKGFKMYQGNPATTQWPTINTVSLDETLKLLPEIPLSTIYLAEGGPIFTVYEGKKYIYPTMDDFFGLGANSLLIRRVSAEIENLPGLTFGSFHLSNGRLYKINDNPHQIYRINGDTSQLVNSINYPGLPYDRLITVDPVTAQRYPVSGEYLP
jgi:hypothetical protein